MPPINVLNASAPRHQTGGRLVPKRVFICEGSNTEEWYLNRLFDRLDSSGVTKQLTFEVIGRSEDEAGWSGLPKLSEIALKVHNGVEAKEFDEELKRLAREFDDRRDKIVIVFDTDRIADQGNWDNFHSFLRAEWERGHIPVPLRPNFELFLLLHADDSQRLIMERKRELLECRKSKMSGKRPSEELVRKTFGFNPKTDKTGVESLVDQFDRAASSELMLNQIADKAEHELTSNLAYIINAFIRRSD